METATLGVVIPTLNCAKTLTQTLCSLQRLGESVQVLVVDSCSVDGTPDIARRHGIEVLSAPPDGMYAAINAGLHSLNTKWLCYLNGDDLIYSVQASLAAGDRNGVDVVYGAVDFIDNDGRFIHSWSSAAPNRLLPLYRAGCSPLLQQGTVFRREVFESLSGFNPRWRFCGDADFWLRALLAGHSFARIDHPPVAAFRMHAGQLSRQNASAMQSEFEVMLESHGIKPRRLASVFHAGSFRAMHLRQDLLRFLRHRDLAAYTRLSRAYEIPAEENSD